jgi:hypothetical protein
MKSLGNVTPGYTGAALIKFPWRLKPTGFLHTVALLGRAVVRRIAQRITPDLKTAKRVARQLLVLDTLTLRRMAKKVGIKLQGEHDERMLANRIPLGEGELE